MYVRSKLVTICHYTVLTHTVFCGAMQTNSFRRPTGYQSAAISESMHQSTSTKSLWNTASVHIYTTQLFGKICSTQLHTSQCKGYISLTLLNFTSSFLTQITFSVMMSIITTFSTACHIPTFTRKYMYNKPKSLVWHEKHLTAIMVARPTTTDTMELA